ncbi:MAG: peptide chain release factor 2 [Lentisphaerae bacterium RIFOXYA12_FULL_48_11]|nr:MAG: peptide chain release factor 2 [Lentisphaerae bacterium RIFOXYA12_FULL_48_11]
MHAWLKCEVIFDVANREKALAELDRQASTPSFWNDQAKARQTIEKTNQLRAILKPYGELGTLLQDSELLVQLAEEEENENQQSQVLYEIDSHLKDAERTFNKLEFQLLLNGELDGNNAYLTLHAGAGGTESCDWTEMLMRMYRRYCEDRGFTIEVMEFQPGDEAGIKRITFLVSGSFAYGYLKAERGVHRLVRISPFDSNKRRHTSFAALDVVAEISEDVDVEIDDNDLKIDTYRSSGAGGQHVNTTDSAVRISHIPSGIIVACQAERSQHMNRMKAMNMLRAQLYEKLMDQKRQSMEKFYGEKGDISWGNQIRSYVLQPYTLVKDHRTEVETGNTGAVLDGDIHHFVEAYLKKRAQDIKVA